MILKGLILLAIAGCTYEMCKTGLDFAGPFKDLGIRKIERAYDPKKRSGEIVFYGASNFTRWTTMEKDIPRYKVQNHGFGGSDDKNLIDYAERILYPYAPKVVVFQTGSNDYVHADGTDEEKIRFCMERKIRMFGMFHERMPDAKFIVLSGLLLPGRSQFTRLTQEVNRQLKELCDGSDYMSYVDAEKMTFKNGNYESRLFVKDGIHLTSEARIIWAKEYIVPALDELAGEMGEDADSIRR